MLSALACSWWRSCGARGADRFRILGQSKLSIVSKRYGSSQCFNDLKNSEPFFLISGPCVIESADHALRTASRVQAICERLQIPFIYKSSFDKANRTSILTSRGPGLDEGLEVLAKVKKELGVLVTTDVHECAQVAAVAEVADVIQIPAMLCRQTDLITTAAATGRVVNIKKAQSADTNTILQAASKAASAGSGGTLVTERGTFLGYGDLVVDMRNLVLMRASDALVVQDVTHSVQRPGLHAQYSGGQRHLIPSIARAAVAVGVHGLFFETHEQPEIAPSDSAVMWPLGLMEPLLRELVLIAKASQGLRTPGADVVGQPSAPHSAAEC